MTPNTPVEPLQGGNLRPFLVSHNSSSERPTQFFMLPVIAPPGASGERSGLSLIHISEPTRLALI
eukprot:1846922-Alexandrium_andersonii.AAC.1